MAQGKGGKADPRVVGKGEEHYKTIVKLSQIKKIMKDRTRMRVSKDALVAVAACVVYLVSEITDGAKSIATTDKKKKVMPKHINSAICNDTELSFIGHDWMIKSGGTKACVSHPDVAGTKGSSRD